MKIDFIPFQIGEQYENWEFDLEPFHSTKTYDQYLYLKKDINKIFNIPIQQVLLSFNLDILFQVEYHFNAIYYHYLKEKLIEFLATGTFREYRDRLEWENGRVCAILEIPFESKTLILKVIDKKYLDYC